MGLERGLTMSHYDWVFGLNVMNIALGMVVVVPLLLLAYGVVSELVTWSKSRRGLRDLAKRMQEPFYDGLVSPHPPRRPAFE